MSSMAINPVRSLRNLWGFLKTGWESSGTFEKRFRQINAANDFIKKWSLDKYGAIQGKVDKNGSPSPAIFISILPFSREDICDLSVRIRDMRRIPLHQKVFTIIDVAPSQDLVDEILDVLKKKYPDTRFEEEQVFYDKRRKLDGADPLPVYRQ